MTWQAHMIPFLAIFGAGFAVVLLLEPLVLRYALKRGLVDPPN